MLRCTLCSSVSQRDMQSSPACLACMRRTDAPLFSPHVQYIDVGETLLYLAPRQLKNSNASVCKKDFATGTLQSAFTPWPLRSETLLRPCKTPGDTV